MGYVSSVLPASVTERVTRKWGVNKVNDVGTVTTTIDVLSENNTGYSVVTLH